MCTIRKTLERFYSFTIDYCKGKKITILAQLLFVLRVNRNTRFCGDNSNTFTF